MKKIISFLLCIVIVTSSLFIVSGNENYNNTETTISPDLKISKELSDKMKSVGEDELISVYLWLEDVDHKEIAQKVYEKTGFTQEYFEQDHFKNNNPIKEDLSEEEMQKEFIQRYEETEEIRQKIKQEVDIFQSQKRCLYSEFYNAKNTDILKNLNIPEKNILFLSSYSPMNICELTVSQIENIAKNLQVTSLDLFVEQDCINDSSTSVVETIGADHTRDTYGLIGTNVKIGQIEAGTPDASYSGFGGKVTVIGNTNYNMHADNVAMSMHNVAPNANIYSINMSNYSSLYSGVETLITAGVSIINMSASWTRGTNYYTTAERWIDHISPTHEVTFTKSSGNEANGNYNVSIPGLAYNIITVGAINDNETGNDYSDDFFATYTCTDNNGSGGCAKPDIVAPGNTYGMVGTSFAAPLVAGTVAQIMQYDTSLTSRARAVKAIITACCYYKATGTGETMAQGFTWAQGAGVISADCMRDTLTYSKYVSGSFSGAELSLSTDLLWEVNLSANWINLVTVDHNTQIPTNATLKNLSLYLYDSNGNQVGSSNIDNSSVEIINSTTLTDVTYTIKLKKTTTDSDTVYYGIAWY